MLIIAGEIPLSYRSGIGRPEWVSKVVLRREVMRRLRAGNAEAAFDAVHRTWP
jgi:hypothetical protein